MRGCGMSYGAISVLNAIPCGIGSTIGIGLRTEAVFEDDRGTTVIAVGRPDTDTGLAETCARRAMETIGAEGGFRLTVRTEIPGSVGLKSSSSVCNAVISSVLDAYGERMDDADRIRLGVRCARECGVTVTGSFDDACGCDLGGLVVTDNRTDRILLRKSVPGFDVVLCLPDTDVRRNREGMDGYGRLHDTYLALVPMIENDYLRVLTENGRHVGRVTGDATGLTERALSEGALAAGVTGMGPAVSVVVDKGKGGKMAASLGCRTIVSGTR